MRDEPFDFARDFNPGQDIMMQCFELIIARLRRNYRMIQLFVSANNGRGQHMNKYPE
ncbi:hypothetical protein JDV02_002458 [Purpureocillium takamizusanense]|uniref:Uncharacterized protein n=1 Tax=Purpureocillium takamizusanense TaxID=2060973 RepID=A0A9Q8V8N6_9HYPO|nr:uncharacterized protein JDV02_002458 [Purpureocillium takamizusanense]UNI15977.1 hypothetical protein JDV02_002458 [Purpureocillium takamizusanense]